MDLHGPVGRLAAQPVRPVVAHRHLVGDTLFHLRMGHLVHLPRGLADQQAQHLGLGGQFHQRPLDGLVLRQGAAERLAHPGVFDALIDAIDRRPQRAGRLADAVFVHEGLGQGQPALRRPKHRAVGRPDIGETDPWVVGGHVEGPHPLLDLHPRIIGGDQDAGDAAGVAVLAAGAAEQGAMGGHMHAGGPHLLAVDAPAGHAVPVLADGRRLHEGGVGAMIGLGQAEGDPPRAVEHTGDELLLLSRRAEVAEHDDEGVVGDDRVLGLLVVMQAQPLRRQMLPDHRHPQVGAVLAAEFLGQGEAQMAGLVGAPLGLAHQRLPLRPRQAVIVEVGARPLAAVIEEPLVVVLRLQRLDLGLDEGVEHAQIVGQVLGDVEIHHGSPFKAALGAGFGLAAARR